jgi:Putative MetA-pathway of phenol degradation
VLFRLPARHWMPLAIVLFAPSLAFAQARAEQREVAVAATDETAAVVALELPPPAKAVAAEQAVRPVVAGRRRRPSMVGYIEDSTIESRVRFRFDSGAGNNVPDRAEFFYGKCGCYKSVPPPAFDPDAPGPGGGIPTEIDFQEFYSFVEYAVNGRFSVFGDLPFRGIDPQAFVPTGLPDWEGESGLGDLRFGGKASLFDDGETGITAMVRMSVPTGDAQKGLGTNHASIEPTLLMHSALNDRIGVEAQFGYWASIGGSDGVNSEDSFAGDVLTWGIGPSFDAYSSSSLSISPIVELVGWHVIGGFKTCVTCDSPDAGGTNIVNLKFGARAMVNGRHSIYGGFGWHLTDEVWYDKLFRFEYRLGF